ADNDAGCVSRSVTIEAFELLGDIEGALDHLIAIAFGLQTRLPLDRLFERDRCRRILRHQLAKFVDLSIRHLQHATDIAQHAARPQRAKSDDLSDLVATVALLNVADHFIATVLAEVDIEVRHRHTLGIEEALEEQPETDRIKVGDGQRVGNERTRTRTAAGSNGYALFLRTLDEIGNDQEIARVFHAGDHTKLEIEPFPILIDSMAWRDTCGFNSAFKALLRTLAQLARFIEHLFVIACRKARENGLVRAWAEGTALRDLDGVS